MISFADPPSLIILVLVFWFSGFLISFADTPLLILLVFWFSDFLVSYGNH
jgi:hypothetical protein